MNNFFLVLKIIYLNRYRQFTYKDSSVFWIPILAYLILIFKMFIGTFPSLPAFDYKEYVVLYFSFYISQLINIRTDWNLLKGLFNTKKTYLIYFIDLVMANILNLSVSIYNEWVSITIIIFLLILFFTFYRAKINQPVFKFPFKILDILTITQLRRFKINYLIYCIIYYISYQSLIENNRNLYIGCTIGIIILLLLNSQKTEKLDYFIHSKLSNKQYIIKNETAFLQNCIFLIFPNLVLALVVQPIFFLYGVMCLLLIPSTFPIKYIFINHLFPIGMISMLVIVYFFSIVQDQIDWWMLSTIVPISYIVHIIAFKKFTKEKISTNSEFYL